MACPSKRASAPRARETSNHFAAIRKYEGEDAYRAAYDELFKRDPERAKKHEPAEAASRQGGLIMAVGMSVPGASDLGLGSTDASGPDETDEERRKRSLLHTAAADSCCPACRRPPAPSDILMAGYSGRCRLADGRH